MVLRVFNQQRNQTIISSFQAMSAWIQEKETEYHRKEVTYDS